MQPVAVLKAVVGLGKVAAHNYCIFGYNLGGIAWMIAKNELSTALKMPVLGGAGIIW